MEYALDTILSVLNVLILTNTLCLLKSSYSWKKKTKVFMDEGAWYLQITQGSEIYKQGAHMNGNTKGAKCNDWWIKVKSAGGFFVVFLVKKISLTLKLYQDKKVFWG